MMKPLIECLHDEEVGRLLTGEVDAARTSELEQHLADCIDCRQRLEQQVGDDGWWNETESSLRSQHVAASLRDAEDGPAYAASLGDTRLRESVLDLLGPTDDPNMLGRIGPYEIIGLLGQGGMGAVFKGFDRSLNRFVAIKMLLPHLAASGAARKRFAREGQAVAAVVDDHVMAIHCVDEWQGVPYLVMIYSRGVSLQKRLSDNGPLEVREILRIGMQAAKGLAAAHAQGIVHRDIKPANIFLDQSVERVQLMDFGLARAVDDASLTRSGTLAGTPQYMSPEQARAETVDHRSDLFSLGSVLYAMCTGHAPFRAESSYSVLRLITDKDPRAIREINTDVPEWLCLLISRLMAKSPADRFGNALQVADLLGQCLAHVQQPTSVPLPASLVPQAAGRRSIFKVPRKGVLAMLGTIGMTLLGMVLLQATEAPDISGQWTSDEWGTVVLVAKGPGEYEGTFTGSGKDKLVPSNAPTGGGSGAASVPGGGSVPGFGVSPKPGPEALRGAVWGDFDNDGKLDVSLNNPPGGGPGGGPNGLGDRLKVGPNGPAPMAFDFPGGSSFYLGIIDRETGQSHDSIHAKSKLGTLRLKWSRLERRFNGTWGKGADRSGTMSLRLVDNEIRGAFTTDEDVQLETGTPLVGDLLWKRSVVTVPDGGTVLLGGLGEPKTAREGAKPLDLQNARAVVEAFVAAALAGDGETVITLAKLNRRDPKRPTERIENMIKFFPDREHLPMTSVHVNDAENPTDAIAISEQFKWDHPSSERKTDVVAWFTLSMSETGWIVTNISFEWIESTDGLLQKFLEANPKAVNVPPLTKRPAGNQFHDLQGVWEYISVEADGAVTEYKTPVSSEVLSITDNLWKMNSLMGSVNRVEIDGRNLTFHGKTSTGSASGVGGDVPSIAYGIYTLDDGSLDFCMTPFVPSSQVGTGGMGGMSGGMGGMPGGMGMGGMSGGMSGKGGMSGADAFAGAVIKRPQTFETKGTQNRTYRLRRSAAKVSAIEQPLDRHNARTVVEAFVGAILAGDKETVDRLSTRRFNELEHLVKMIEFLMMYVPTLERLPIESVSVNDAANPSKAIALSELFKWDHRIIPKADRPTVMLRFELGMSEEGWFVTEISFDTKDLADVELKKFLEGSPNAISVPPQAVSKAEKSTTIEKSLDRQNARAVVEAFFAAAIAGDEMTINTLAPISRSQAGVELYVSELKFLKAAKLPIESVYVNDLAKPTKAMATSVEVRLGGKTPRLLEPRDGSLVLTLDMRENGWTVTDIDFESKETAEKESGGPRLADLLWKRSMVTIESLPEVGVLRVKGEKKEVESAVEMIRGIVNVQAMNIPKPKRLQIREATVVEANADSSQQSVESKVVEFSGARLRLDPSQPAILTEDDIMTVESVTDPNNPKASQIVLTLTPEAGERFQIVTTRLSSLTNPGYLVIEFDGTVLSAPRVNNKINNEVVISFAQRDRLDMERVDAAIRESIATREKVAEKAPDARSVVEAFVAFALAGDVAKAAALAKNSPADPKRIAEIPKFLNVQRLKIETVYVNDPAKPARALATSVAVKLDGEHKQPDGQRDGFMVFRLELTDDKWFVIDIDFESDAGAEKELKRFLEANPNSIGLPPLTSN